MASSPKHRLFLDALKYSFPVFLGYLAIGSAFGFLMADAGYPWWLALMMSVIMYAGAGQYIAVGLFAAGTTLWEAALVQFVVNARHIAYGLSMMNRFRNLGPLKYYAIFGMTDETFALLSSLPESDDNQERVRFILLVTLLDHIYWITGALIGAIAGAIIPFSTEGIGYALTALFIVLMIEQMLRLRKPEIFIISAILAVICVIFLPARASMLVAMAISLVIGSFFPRSPAPKAGEHRQQRGGT